MGYRTIMLMGDELFLEDFHVGDRFYSGEEILITAEEIIGFAEQYDPQPGHLSEELAQSTPFAGLSASGWQTACITMKLMADLGFIGAIGAEVTITWPTPTRPGDRLHVDAHVASVRDSRTKPDRGVVVLEYDTVNQDAEIRQHTKTTVIAWRRGAVK